MLICRCLSYTQRKDRSTNSLAGIAQYKPNYRQILTSVGSKVYLVAHDMKMRINPLQLTKYTSIARAIEKTATI